MRSVFKSAPAAPPLPDDRIDPEYKRLRRQVFAGIFIGYATMMACCVFTMLFSALTLSHKAESQSR